MKNVAGSAPLFSGRKLVSTEDFHLGVEVNLKGKVENLLGDPVVEATRSHQHTASMHLYASPDPASNGLSEADASVF